MTEVWHRYDAWRHRDGVELRHKQFAVLGHTPNGVWLERAYDKPCWVKATARKRFAYPTEEEAIRSLIARKERQIAICKHQIDTADRVIFQAKQRLSDIEEAGL